MKRQIAYNSAVSGVNFNNSMDLCGAYSLYESPDLNVHDIISSNNELVEGLLEVRHLFKLFIRMALYITLQYKLCNYLTYLTSTDGFDYKSWSKQTGKHEMVLL